MGRVVLFKASVRDRVCLRGRERLRGRARPCAPAKSCARGEALLACDLALQLAEQVGDDLHLGNAEDVAEDVPVSMPENGKTPGSMLSALQKPFTGHG